MSLDKVTLSTEWLFDQSATRIDYSFAYKLDGYKLLQEWIVTYNQEFNKLGSY